MITNLIDVVFKIGPVYCLAKYKFFFLIVLWVKYFYTA